jgi:hypothetical protein
MDIKFSISPAPGIATDWLVAALYEETAPTTLVQSQGFAAPHTASQNISFTGLNPVPHIVIIYQNAANVAAGTIRHRFIYDPNFIDAEIRSDMVLTADTTPGFVSTGLSYTDATLKDWSFDIERRGFGTMEPGVDYSWDKRSDQMDTAGHCGYSAARHSARRKIHSSFSAKNYDRYQHGKHGGRSVLEFF